MIRNDAALFISASGETGSPSAATKSDPLSKITVFSSVRSSCELRENPAQVSSSQHEHCEIQREKKRSTFKLRLIVSSAAIGSHLVQWFKHVAKTKRNCKLLIEVYSMFKGVSKLKKLNACDVESTQQSTNIVMKLYML